MRLIDHINTNNFLNNDMHSGTITVDILDHFPISLISKDLMLQSRNEPIAKWEIYDKSKARFKTLLPIVDCKHVLTENFPNNAYNIFWKHFGAFTMTYFHSKIKKKNLIALVWLKR